jgi:hypothetical protein
MLSSNAWLQSRGPCPLGCQWVLVRASEEHDSCTRPVPYAIYVSSEFLTRRVIDGRVWTRSGELLRGHSILNSSCGTRPLTSPGAFHRYTSLNLWFLPDASARSRPMFRSIFVPHFEEHSAPALTPRPPPSFGLGHLLPWHSDAVDKNWVSAPSVKFTFSVVSICPDKSAEAGTRRIEASSASWSLRSCDLEGEVGPSCASTVSSWLSRCLDFLSALWSLLTPSTRKLSFFPSALSGDFACCWPPRDEELGATPSGPA